jgi:hypothetical protein
MAQITDEPAIQDSIPVIADSLETVAETYPSLRWNREQVEAWNMRDREYRNPYLNGFLRDPDMILKCP